MKTIAELIDKIYEDNSIHFDFDEDMGGDCDCHLHTTIKTIVKFMEEEEGL